MLGRVGRTDLIWINHDELLRALRSAIGRLVPVRGIARALEKLGT
jgi:hypothetical protein